MPVDALLERRLGYGYDALSQPSTRKAGYETALPIDLVASIIYTSQGEIVSTTLLDSGHSATIVHNYAMPLSRGGDVEYVGLGCVVAMGAMVGLAFDAMIFGEVTFDDAG